MSGRRGQCSAASNRSKPPARPETASPQYAVGVDGRPPLMRSRSVAVEMLAPELAQHRRQYVLGPLAILEARGQLVGFRPA